MSKCLTFAIVSFQWATRFHCQFY